MSLDGAARAGTRRAIRARRSIRPAWDFAPRLSPDGKIFVFTSNRGFGSQALDRKLTFDELERRLHAPGNGLRDIYYVSADALLALELFLSAASVSRSMTSPCRMTFSICAHARIVSSGFAVSSSRLACLPASTVP